MNWLKESNRTKHLVYAIPCAFLLTILFVAGLAAGIMMILMFAQDNWRLVWSLRIVPTVANGTGWISLPRC